MLWTKTFASIINNMLKLRFFEDSLLGKVDFFLEFGNPFRYKILVKRFLIDISFQKRFVALQLFLWIIVQLFRYSTNLVICKIIFRLLFKGEIIVFQGDP